MVGRFNERYLFSLTNLLPLFANLFDRFRFCSVMNSGDLIRLTFIPSCKNPFLFSSHWYMFTFFRFLLSLGSCKYCLVLDDQLRILPISTESRNIAAIPPKTKVCYLYRMFSQENWHLFDSSQARFDFPLNFILSFSSFRSPFLTKAFKVYVAFLHFQLPFPVFGPCELVCLNKIKIVELGESLKKVFQILKRQF